MIESLGLGFTDQAVVELSCKYFRFHGLGLEDLWLVVLGFESLELVGL